MKRYPTPTLHLLPLRERPAYRVTDAGADACNLVELLAAVVGGREQIEIAHNLLAEFEDLAGLARAPARQLETVPGLGPATAARLKAALELGRRLSQVGTGERQKVSSPADAAALVAPEMGLLEQEELRAIILDTQMQVLGIETIYRGNLNSVAIRPVEVFRPAVRLGVAASIIVVHNHPSGQAGPPSPEDVEVTRRLVAAGGLLGVEVVDHVIVGAGGRFVSLKERGLGF
jgi:DNA repair protein RadC